jgi:hypothetical protein
LVIPLLPKVDAAKRPGAEMVQQHENPLEADLDQILAEAAETFCQRDDEPVFE